MIKKVLKYFFWILIILFSVALYYFFIGEAKPAEKITWGVNFSQKHSEKLGLDWKKNYLALLDDLKVKKLKIPTYWDLVEPEMEVYNFKDLDWQIEKAEEKNANIILEIGMKTSRWPECHIPSWAKNLSKEEQQAKILELIKKIVLRYKNSPSIEKWQVENEPFFIFGECPWQDKNFLKKEVEFLKSLDLNKKPVIISDTGEISLWFDAAKIGDIVGITMYRKVWFKELGFYLKFPFKPIFYQRKANLIKKIFGKKVINIEFKQNLGALILFIIALLKSRTKQ
jgi:hypothetical protein